MTHREKDLRAVCQAGHLVFERLCLMPLRGLTEVQVAQSVKRLYRELGINQLAFSSIVAAGKHAAEPHHVPNHQRKLKTGDAVVLDFGGKMHGWCGDMSRTVFIGTPSAWQREMYMRIVEAQVAAVKAIRVVEPGLYFKGRAGFRVEDMVWVTKKGGEWIVSSDRGWEHMVLN